VNALLTLTYGDRRGLANAARALLRKPGRVVAWAAWALAIALFAVFRTRTARAPGVHADPGAIFLADLWVGMMLAAFGIVLTTGAHRFVGVFSSRAEALFLTGSQVPPVLVAGYLQIRAVVATLVQSAARFAYLVVVAVPAGARARGFVFEALFFAAVAAATASVALPRALLRGAARTAAQIGGAAIVVAAALPLLADAAASAHVRSPLAAALARAAWHPGAVLLALARGDARGLVAPLALAVLASAAFAAVARDRYPELYAIALDTLEWRARRTARRNARTANARGAVASRRLRGSARGGAPPGALAFVWADALGFARRSSPALVAAVALLALAGGAALGALARAGSEIVVAGAVAGTLPLLVIGFAATSGIRLAPLLHLPLFWLGDVPLAARLAAWTFGGVWRDVALLLLAAIGYAAVTHAFALAATVVTFGAGLFALTRSIGVAVFALFPNALDQRGPAVVLRTLLTYVLLAPPLAAATIAGIALRAPAPAAFVLAAAALAEAAALVGFAAWRLAGRVDALAAS